MKKRKNELAPMPSSDLDGERAYRYLGAHREGKCIVFRVWAPNASSAFVVGDFNLWDESCPMKRDEDGIFSASLDSERVSVGDRYKFKLKTVKGDVYRSDPYGFWFEDSPEMATRFFESRYVWRDEGWLSYRAKNAAKLHESPLNIYELHLGSWRRNSDGSFRSYTDIARELAPYVKSMGYTHIQLMPVSEHKDYNSCGYGVSGFYAPTFRYGDPDGFRAFIDYMHRSGIGVILEWVPSHFEKCAHGLSKFDGTPIYEDKDPFADEKSFENGSRFDLSSENVRSFLISNAVFWAESFHADGLLVDSVDSMLYPDHEKGRGGRKPNVYVSRRCTNAVSFFRELNSRLKKIFPDVITVAKESAAWSNVTGFENGGLGFDLKWNMGWTSDTLDYAAVDPYFRPGVHDKLKFPAIYSFSEKYILPISHREVSAPSPSFLDRMPGDYRKKFAGARLFAAYQICFPGKKLGFMGTEIGQFRAFDCNTPTEWFLLGYDMHAKLKEYFSQLNHFYLSHPALYKKDRSRDSFRWLLQDRRDISVAAFARTDGEKSTLFAVFNFTPVVRYGFELELPEEGVFSEVFNSDRTEYGGDGVINGAKLRAVKENGKCSVRITLPPLGCVIFEKN